MKRIKSGAKRGGFSFIDSLIVVVTVLLLVTVVWPWWAKSRAKACRINCVSNVKQIGLSFRMWANDKDGKYPMVVSKDENGSMEYNETGEVFRHFEAMSNELSSPKVLVCPDDAQRVKASVWSGLNNQNISFFVGLEAEAAKPQTILSGDRNITGGVSGKGNVMLFKSNSPAGWTRIMHKTYGNVGLGDGSVQQVTNLALQKQLQAEFKSITNEVIRLAIP